MSRVNREKLRELVAEVGPSARALSLAAGLGATAIKDVLSGKSRDPGAATLSAVASVLGVDVSQLLEEDAGRQGIAAPNVKLAPRFLSVRYVTRAGHWRDIDADEPPEQVQLAVPPNPRFSEFPQWLEKVEGDSVDKRIPDGFYAHVVDALEMGYAPKTGDWVVVERRRDDGAIRERTIKQVEVDAEGAVHLWPRSNNPKWQTRVDLDAGARSGESVEVAIVGVVIGAYDGRFPVGGHIPK